MVSVSPILMLNSSNMAMGETPLLPLQLTRYKSQEPEWPTSGKHILAQYDDTSIIVYQAFKPSIAKQIVLNQCYHAEGCIQAGVSMQRMTWVKPNFLWMMFRSGWASKQDQERILAIRLTRNVFDEILSTAVLSRDSGVKGPGKEDLVRVQWDPDHLPNGEKVAGRRAIQLGLRGEMFERMSREFIVRIDDVTEFVVKMRELVDSDELMIPVEKVYRIQDEDIAKKIGIDSEM